MKKVKCEFTIEELFFIRYLITKYKSASKRKIRNEFLDEDNNRNVKKYIQEKLEKNVKTAEEWETINAEWKRIKNKHKVVEQVQKAKEPKKETKAEPIPRTRVWHAEDEN